MLEKENEHPIFFYYSLFTFHYSLSFNDHKTCGSRAFGNRTVATSSSPPLPGSPGRADVNALTALSGVQFIEKLPVFIEHNSNGARPNASVL